ncbi:MAG: hypothetical protein ACOY82_12635 [Pseudomonadota bacterium]
MNAGAGHGGTPGVGIVKRIGFVGLSTPSFYDYAHRATTAPSDRLSSPNPVIEGAFGALLLYDELWFLCRSLCPENMRGLPYVRFLDEEGRLPPVDPEWLPDPESMFDAASIASFREAGRAYDFARSRAGIHWEAAADNHTHGLQVGEHRLTGNSWSIKNVMYDVLLTERLPDNVELITNSFSAALFKAEAGVNAGLLLTERLVLDDVPQHMSPKGPYHPCVEEVRESAFLSNFRQWMATAKPGGSPAEIEEIKREVEAKLQEAQREVFLRHLDPKGSFRSFADTIIGVGMDAIVPGAATIKDLLGQRNAEKEKQGMRWQGFLLDARHRLRRGMPPR